MAKQVVPRIRRKRSTTTVIQIPRGEISDVTLGKGELRKVQRILSAGKRSEAAFYQMPEEGDDLVMRLVHLARCDISDVTVDDCPDYEDLEHTDLPWTGMVTFNQATKEYRAKYGVMASIETIREFDGFLYQLTTSFLPASMGKIPQLHVMQEIKKGRMAFHDEIHITNYDLDIGAGLEEMVDAAKIPDSLIKALADIGYTYSDEAGAFYVDGQEITGIRVRLWGKLIRAK